MHLQQYNNMYIHSNIQLLCHHFTQSLTPEEYDFLWLFVSITIMALYNNVSYQK